MDVNFEFQHSEYIKVKDQLKDLVDPDYLIHNRYLENYATQRLEERFNISNNPDKGDVEEFGTLEDDWAYNAVLAMQKEKKFISFIENNLDKVKWSVLSANTCAIHILENNVDRIDWYALSSNPNAISILENNVNKIDWYQLQNNPNAKPILENNLYKVNWEAVLSGKYYKEWGYEFLEKNISNISRDKWHYWALLCNYDFALPLLKQNLDKINWGRFIRNSKQAIQLLEENIENIKLVPIQWYDLSKFSEFLSEEFIKKYLKHLDLVNLTKYNKNMISFLENNLEIVNWYELSTNPDMIHVLENNLDRVDWMGLSENTAAIHILENNLDKVDSRLLSSNPAAINILLQNPNFVNMENLCYNKNITQLFKNGYILTSWYNFVFKADTLPILEDNLDLPGVDWIEDIILNENLNSNMLSPKIIEYIKNNLHNIIKNYKGIESEDEESEDEESEDVESDEEYEEEDETMDNLWNVLSKDPVFIDVLVHNKKKYKKYIDTYLLSGFNSGIFNYDYDAIKNNSIDINAYFYHPKFYNKYLEKYGDFVDEDHYLDWFLFKK